MKHLKIKRKRCQNIIEFLKDCEMHPVYRTNCPDGMSQSVLVMKLQHNNFIIPDLISVINKKDFSTAINDSTNTLLTAFGCRRHGAY